jgi:hypothetical protein
MEMEMEMKMKRNLITKKAFTAFIYLQLLLFLRLGQPGLSSETRDEVAQRYMLSGIDWSEWNRRV